MGVVNGIVEGSVSIEGRHRSPARRQIAMGCMSSDSEETWDPSQEGY